MNWLRPIVFFLIIGLVYADTCEDITACNYLENDYCYFPEVNCDCDSNIIDPAYVCDGRPVQFDHNTSMYQAFYYFQSVTINGTPVEAEDWVGAFNGDVCVGTRKWDTDQCGGGVCDLPVLGDGGDEYTQGYCNQGDPVTFKIYDASESVYLNAVATEDHSWVDGTYQLITSLQAEVSIPGCTNDIACNYDPFSTADDGNCEYAEENYNCDGYCIAVEDCAGQCGGSAVVDECGECGGNGCYDQNCDTYPAADYDCFGDDLSIHDGTMPDTYNIHNIYPNPFNPTTNIEYRVPENASIELIVYNIHGQPIQTLVKGFQTAGYHSINWNASNYPSGVYIIRLESAKYSKSQKAVLIK